MKLSEILRLIETKNSWGKEQLKLAILDLLASQMEIKRDDEMPQGS